MKAMQFKTLNWFAAALAVAVLAGCSGGGAATTENPVTQAPPVTDYVGPAAANADVQAFRINLWENIKANNRCGSCHGAGGQTPQFARNDDVNLAYQAANTVVNLSARSVAHGPEGRRRPQLLAAVARGLRRHAHRLDPQLGGFGRDGRHADPASGAPH
jgi:mono/diheme cytochrome c family protein